MCSTILSRVAQDSLYGFRLDVHKTGQAILADLDSFVLLFDRYCPFHGEISIVDGESTLPKERFNHGESVVSLEEKAGRRALDTHRDSSLLCVLGPSQLVLPMDHAARKLLSVLLTPWLLFRSDRR